MRPSKPLTYKRLFRYGMQGAVLAALATAGVIVFTTAQDTPVQLREFTWGYLPLLLLLVVGAWTCNGLRVWILAGALGEHLSIRQALVVSLSTEFGIAASPGGVGGPVIRLALLKRAGISVGTAASMLATDTLLDLLFFTLLLPVSIWIILHDADWSSLLHLPGLPSWRTLTALLAGFLFFALVVWWNRRNLHLLHARIQKHPFARKRRLGARVRILIRRLRRIFHHSVASTGLLLRTRRRALVYDFGLATIMWSCRYGILPLLLVAGHSSRNPLPLVPVQGVLFMLSLLVLLPGGGGSLELLTPFLLRPFVPASMAGIVVVLWRLFTFHLYLLAGGSVFFWACGHLDRLFPCTENQSDEERRMLEYGT